MKYSVYSFLPVYYAQCLFLPALPRYTAHSHSCDHSRVTTRSGFPAAILWVCWRDAWAYRWWNLRSVSLLRLEFVRWYRLRWIKLFFAHFFCSENGSVSISGQYNVICLLKWKPMIVKSINLEMNNGHSDLIAFSKMENESWTHLKRVIY